ncbi:nucleoside triphosphate pyrophosphohydrolase [Chitinophaga nivalis]|uniref:Nucleoside triphosphate pyrophosphohydrolase n=1 Tax=Chitinophaga nivalis TaxID=2991709 RepID=A0ABT3IQ11_9BACT|nr:nucleoside triphosphate pyrophosphohydrolase [Chitinophaga nivalis]MCW3464252.1 nucleoside triphosphate pyrophosphohydrolase [Chitinophaga nivalis]MCW3486057.1 nucleoside triphosphate pyrophosphohydrolase [Chitinophaga nivalis]
MEKKPTFDRLLQIMDDLREKCPWDRKQTIQTLRQLTIEETYELADAITDEDWKSIKEELGDILLHIVFYAKIGAEQQKFDINDVINGVCEKLIHRHPHIYGDVTVADEEEVKQNWEKLKLKEGKKSVLSGVPVSLPALVKAMRLQEKAKQTGFEWETADQVWEKVKEEVHELEEAVQTKSQEEKEAEFGDVMFSLVNYSRFLQIDAENALERTNKKFQRRFQEMEAMALQQGRTLNDMTLTEMDTLWNQVKAAEQV